MKFPFSNIINRTLLLAWRPLHLAYLGLLLFGRLALAQIKTPGPTIKKAKLLKAFFENAGGAYIKAGQILSMRYDLLPAVFCEELTTLLDHTQAYPLAQIQQIIQQVKIPLVKLESTALASASIAQVHKGKLAAGSPIVIKVKRPGTDLTFKTDIGLLRLTSRLCQFLKIGRKLSLSKFLLELASALQEEIDFSAEIQNLIYFRKFAQGFSEMPFRLPTVFPEYSNNDMICMEYVEGISFQAIIEAIEAGASDKIIPSGVTREQLAQQLFRGMTMQFFEADFFHADPHPGNIILLPDGNICFIDFGIVGRMSSRFRKLQIRYLLALGADDLDEAVNVFTRMLTAGINADEEKLKRLFYQQLRYWTYMHHDESVPALARNSYALIQASMQTIQNCNFRLATHSMRYYKCVLTLEYLLYRLYPSFDMVVESRAYFQTYFQRKISSDSNELLTHFTKFCKLVKL